MYRKGVSAIIINEKGELLLVNLESFKEEFFAIPGGGVEGNETLEVAVYREVNEELGIDRSSLEMVGSAVSPVKFKFKEIKMMRNGVNYEGSERYFFGFLFVGNKDRIKPKKGEIRTYRWVHPLELKDYLLFNNQLQETTEKIKEIFPSLL